MRSSIATCTLQVLKIGTQADDAAAPAASLYGGQGTRPGLLSNPAAIACSLDKILVLQTTPQYPQGCIVAFDFKGNPVNCFGSGWLMPLHDEGGVERRRARPQRGVEGLPVRARST